ncbi:Uma2 family endonuclease [Deinococcus sp.]|uniref:Uma2 family endonuclease n=1 Tax=Deinococcus sp. TaxID=47478 RepID=UPI0025CEEB71|nr:Uma2 family endonuclease [Deinococcus sp.]
MSDPAFKTMSVEEYLRTEATSPVKREYVGGFVYPLHGQAGASDEHISICANLNAELHRDARKMGCKLYQSDMRLYIDSKGTYFYPDMVLICDKEDNNRYFKTRPCLIVEVLSESTAAHDRVGKYALYTAIPSLQTYLMIEQLERRVYAYQKSIDGLWAMRELIGNGEIPLPCLDRNLSLNEIYDGVL